MHDPFDPYWQWLAIPPAEQPPDHYRLLGLRTFEDDTQIIARAVQLRIEHVRACDDGLHPDSVERVLQHVAAARDTLLSPRLKAQYDNLLSQKQPAQGAAATQPSAFPAPCGPIPQSAVPPARPMVPFPSQPQGTSRTKARASAEGTAAERSQQAGDLKSLRTWLVVGGGVAALVVVVGLVLSSSSSRDKPARVPSSQRSAKTQVADRFQRQEAPAASRSPRPDATASRDDRNPRTSSPEPARAPRPRGPETMADLMREADDTAADANTVTGKLGACRHAMWSRDLHAARAHVEAAIQAARTPTEQAEVRRVAKLLDSLEAFWTAVRTAAGRLEAAEELRVGDTRVMVVEAGAGSLTIRAAGRNRTYRVEDLPRELAVALAQKALPKGRPTTDLHIGSFLAIDARGDRHDAQTHWDRAGPEGKALLIELTLAPPVQPDQSEEPARSGVMVPGELNGRPPPGRRGASAVHPARKPAQRSPVPDADALTRAEKQIRYLFEAEFESARTAEAKKALADRLFQVAYEVDDDSAAHYVLCRVARDLAVEVGDPEAFCRSIDEMDRWHQIDAISMKAEALTEAWRSKDSVPYRAALAEHSLRLLDAAMTARHYAAAAELVRVAQNAARASKDYGLTRELEDRARQIKAAQQTAQ